MKIWESKPPGTLWATPGLLRNCFTFTFYGQLEDNRIAEGAQTSPRRFCFPNVIPFYGTPVNVTEFATANAVFRYAALHENHK
jgi:hypothetical protein